MRIIKYSFEDDQWGIYVTPMISVSWKNETALWIGWLFWLWKIELLKNGINDKKLSGWKFKTRWFFNKYINGVKCSVGIHDYVRITGHYPQDVCSWCNKDRRFK